MILKKQIGLVSGFLTLSALLGGFSISANAATYYVNANGGSNNYSASESVNNVDKPFLTIKKALDQARTNPGLGVNEIIVEPGTYPESFVISQSGLSLKARNDATGTGARSILKPVGAGIWGVVSIEASNVSLRGFEIDGAGAYVDGTEENGTHGAATNGVSVPGDHPNWNQTATIPAARNVRVAACVIHDCGGGGVAVDGPTEITDPGLNATPVGGPDYVTIEDNIVYNNSFWSRWATSGISLHNMTSANTSDTNPHNIIRRNRIYGNMAKYTKVDKFGATKHTDGNGIIVDYNGNNNPPTLIENNVIYLNGGRGVHIYRSSNVTIRSNSTYKNNQDSDISANGGGGEISVIDGKSVKITNNVAIGLNEVPIFKVLASNEYKNAGGALTSIVIRACTYLGNFGAVPTSGVTDWSTTFYGNPYYVSPMTGNLYPNVAPTQPNKTREQSQTVIDRASTIAGDFAADDFYKTPRPQGAARDRGAIERSLPPEVQRADPSGKRL